MLFGVKQRGSLPVRIALLGWALSCRCYGQEQCVSYGDVTAQNSIVEKVGVALDDGEPAEPEWRSQVGFWEPVLAMQADIDSDEPDGGGFLWGYPGEAIAYSGFCTLGLAHRC